MEQAHSQAFDKSFSLITERERVLKQQEVMKLGDALRYYVGLMNETEYQRPHHRAEKEKEKPQKHDIGSKISFTSFEKGKGKYSSQLIFSNAIQTADAVKMAYKLGTNYSITPVAETLRKSIKESFINSDKMPWPPSVEYLKNIEGVVPEELEMFSKIVLSGSKDCDITILFDTGHGNKKRLINITNLSKHYAEQMCEAMLALHAFTACDSVSSFRCIGKFTCALYGKSKSESIDEVRHLMLKSKCDGDISVDSPTSSTSTWLDCLRVGHA